MGASMPILIGSAASVDGHSHGIRSGRLQAGRLERQQCLEVRQGGFRTLVVVEAVDAQPVVAAAGGEVVDGFAEPVAAEEPFEGSQGAAP